MIISGIKFITEKEMALRCGFSLGWFRKNRATKKDLPHYKLNRKIYYKEEEFNNWLNSKLIAKGKTGFRK